MTFAPPKGNPPEVSWLPLRALQVDDAYQRQAVGRQSEKIIRQIAENWDWRLCSPLTISHRENEEGEMCYFVIDGQHRLRAAEMRGDFEELPCIISKFESYEDEALAFVNVNTVRRQVTALDKYHARVAAKDDLALKVKALVEEAGMAVTRYNDASLWKAGEVSFPDMVAAKMQRSRKDCLDALGVLSIAYTVPLLRGAELFAGVFLVMRGNSWGAATHQRLAEHIGATRQANWAERARRRAAETGHRSDVCMSQILIQEFTKPAQAKAASRLLDNPLPNIKTESARTDSDGKVWCEQCDKRVDRVYARLCMSKFCKAKAA